MAALTAFRIALLEAPQAPAAITGTAAVTEAADTSTASGTYTPPAITGTSATTNANDTSSASGTVTAPGVTGTSATTNADDTSSASGTVAGPGVITGTSATTNVDDTSSASGTFTPAAITGTVSVTNGNDTSTATGTFTPAGYVAPYTVVVTIREDPTVTIREGRMEPPLHWKYRAGDEDPGRAIEWLDGDGNVIDTSSATWSIVFTQVRGTGTSTKTTGITGSATSPNVLVGWATGELAALYAIAKLWTFVITATIAGRDRTVNIRRTGTLELKA